MPLADDLREFIELLNSRGVEYVIVGAYALAFHGHPRYTGDIDFLIGASRENAERVHGVIVAFGFQSLGLSAADFRSSNQIVQLGRPPHRIDVLTSLSGVGFDEVWESRVSDYLDGIPVSFISRDCLIKNKRATDRAQDRADLAALEGD